MKRRNLLVGLLLAFVGLLALSVPIMSQTFQNCGGSFLPNLNCTISGFWAFTSTANGGPFAARDTQSGQTVTATGVVPATTILTNAQVLAMNLTPVTVVPAPGVGKYVDVIGVKLVFDYTGAYTGVQNARLYYGSRASGAAASETITGAGFFDATADAVVRVAGTPSNSAGLPTTNVAVVIQTVTGSMGGGNAANAVRVIVDYRIVTTGL